jgi:hypothetical protein
MFRSGIMENPRANRPSALRSEPRGESGFRGLSYPVPSVDPEQNS